MLPKRNALSLVDDRERLDDDRAVRLEDPGTTEARVRLFAEEVARVSCASRTLCHFAEEVRLVSEDAAALVCFHS